MCKEEVEGGFIIEESLALPMKVTPKRLFMALFILKKWKILKYKKDLF